MTETTDLPMTSPESLQPKDSAEPAAIDELSGVLPLSRGRATKSVLAAILEGDIPVPAIDDRDFAALIERNTRQIKEDEMVHGVITAITKDEIWVDVGFKSLGVIPRSEFSEAADTLKVGDEIDVFVDRLEDSQGRLVLSRRRADFMKTWQQIVELYEKQEIVNVRILRRIKGGFVVDLLGIEAFLPGSQVDMRPVRILTHGLAKRSMYGLSRSMIQVKMLLSVTKYCSKSKSKSNASAFSICSSVA